MSSDDRERSRANANEEYRNDKVIAPVDPFTLCSTALVHKKVHVLYTMKTCLPISVSCGISHRYAK